MKATSLIFITIFLISFTNDNGFVEQEIVFTKKELRTKKVIFTLQVPSYEVTQKREIIKTIGGHGLGFQIHFDTAIIYYNNDWATGSLNDENYKTIGWERYPRISMGPDTVLSGKQLNGRYWKEIKKGDELIGYLNVAKGDKWFFDESISTLKKK